MLFPIIFPLIPAFNPAWITFATLCHLKHSILVLVSWGCYNKLPWSYGLTNGNLLSLSSRGRKSEIRCGQGCPPSKGSEGASFLLLPASGGSRQSLPHCYIANPCLHLRMASSSSLGLWVRTLVIGLRAHLDDPGWSHLETLNLITFA